MISRLYGKVVAARNALYEKGVLKSFSLGAKTVSIGNITVGGTGKTPLVALTAELFAENGEKVCILTRGYGRANPKQRVLVSDGKQVLASVGESGDEPFELAQKLLGKAVVVADANRVAAANWARDKFGITTFVLDDGFQHRRARRDSDIVCIDATNPFGNGKMLPAGILREPLENLARADAIVITRANLVEDISALTAQIRRYNRVCPIFISENRVTKLIELKDFLNQSDGSIETFEKLQTNSGNYLAFCALGNPNNFFEQLRQETFNVTATQRFPDHHFYQAKDIEKLQKKAVENTAQGFLTTAKDAVKLKNLKFEIPCYVVESELIFKGNNFRDWLVR